MLFQGKQLFSNTEMQNLSYPYS